MAAEDLEREAYSAPNPNFDTGHIVSLSPDQPQQIVIAMGGGMDKTGEVFTFLKENGDGGEVYLSTQATREQQDTWNTYKRVFDDLQFDTNNLIHIDSTNDTPTPSQLRPKVPRMLVFAGGDQAKIMDEVSDEDRETIVENNKQGMKVAGWSAGAAVLGEHMIVGFDPEDLKLNDLDSDPDTNYADDFEIFDGLGLVPNAFVDQHFTQRERHQRLAEAVTAVAGIHPENPPWGFGVDENTAAIFVDNEYFDVIGTGTVTVFDGTRRDEWPAEIDSHDIFDGSNGIFTINSGGRFDMGTRQPVYADIVTFGPQELQTVA
ncbi:MAG: cyanophycinase [Candidatus Levybacteria bacterium]|nr:cyanophycinase [Candidatus Levybacteria bacterium]